MCTTQGSTLTEDNNTTTIDNTSESEDESLYNSEVDELQQDQPIAKGYNKDINNNNINNLNDLDDLNQDYYNHSNINVRRSKRL